MAKVQKIDNILVADIVGEISDHKVLVSNYDARPDYLLNKISKNSVVKLIEDNDEIGKFKFVANTYNPEGGGESKDSGEIYRSISTFSLEQVDGEFTNIHNNNTQANILVFPITISLGEIRSFAIYMKNKEDILDIDKIELAIVSNTVNNIAGSKVEFAVEYYGPENDNNTCRPGNDFKTLIVNTEEDKEKDPNIKVTEYKGLFDSSVNYHYLVVLIHSSVEGTSLLGKSTTGNKLVEVGKNMNYCGRWENKTSIYLNDGIIDSSTMTIPSNCEIQTNMGGALPYIEFYQLRNLTINGKSRNAKK